MIIHSKIKKNNELIKLIFFFFIFIGFFVFLFKVPRLGIPICVAYICYLIINPLVPFFMKFKLSKTTSTAVVFFGFLFLSIYPITKIVPAITGEVEKVPSYYPKVERFLKLKYRDLRQEVKQRTGYEFEKDLPLDILKITTVSIKTVLIKAPKYVGSFLELILVIPFLIFFFLKDGRRFRKNLLMLSPNPVFERFYFLYYQFNKKLGDYIFAKFIEASIIGILITSGLLVMEVKFAFLLGLVAGITNIIPYVGPFFGAIPALIFGVVEYGWGATFGAMLILYIVVNVFDLALVFPILVSKIVDLHPVIVVLSVILGSHFFGVVGMVISIPLAAILKLIFIEIFNEVYSYSRS